MKENSVIKVYGIPHGFEVEHDSLKIKSRNISRYQTTNLLILVFVF